MEQLLSGGFQSTFPFHLRSQRKIKSESLPTHTSHNRHCSRCPHHSLGPNHHATPCALHSHSSVLLQLSHLLPRLAGHLRRRRRDILAQWINLLFWRDQRHFYQTDGHSTELRRGQHVPNTSKSLESRQLRRWGWHFSDIPLWYTTQIWESWYLQLQYWWYGRDVQQYVAQSDLLRASLEDRNVDH